MCHISAPFSTTLVIFSGVKVLAYDVFTVDGKENFEDFRKVDAVRLLEFWLDQWVSLDAMQEQGVITGYYPRPDPEELVEMHRSILSWRQCLLQGLLPSKQLNGILSVRDYFGDEIAFFFRFLMHLCNALLFLALLGGFFYFLRTFVLTSESWQIWAKVTSFHQFEKAKGLQSLDTLSPAFPCFWCFLPCLGAGGDWESRNGWCHLHLGCCYATDLQAPHLPGETNMGSDVR